MMKNTLCRFLWDINQQHDNVVMSPNKNSVYHMTEDMWNVLDLLSSFLDDELSKIES